MDAHATCNCSSSIVTRVAVRRVRNVWSSRCVFNFTSPFFESHQGGADRYTRSCAVVSSSGVLNGSCCGRTIDAHDMIIRLNWAPTIPFEQDVGSVTTIQVLNSYNADKLRHSGTRRAMACANKSSLMFNGDIWQDDAAAAKLSAALNNMIGCNKPPIRLGLAKALKISAQNGAFAASKLHAPPLRADWMGGAVEATFRRAWRLSHRRGVRLPTAGFYAVHAALAMCQSISLFGFIDNSLDSSFLESTPGNNSVATTTSAFHYWGDLHPLEAKRSNSTHDISFEHSYYQHLAQGHAEVCEMHSPPGDHDADEFCTDVHRNITRRVRSGSCKPESRTPVRYLELAR